MQQNILIDQNGTSVLENSGTTQEILNEPDPYAGYYKTGLEIHNEDIQMDEYLIDRIIVKGACNALVGGSGVGKSTILRQITLAIIDGDEFVLGFKINADLKKVMYCSTEDTQFQWKKHLRTFNADGSKDEALSRLCVLFDTPNDLLKAIESKLKNEKFDLIVLDVYSDIFIGDPNNSISVRTFIKQFKNLSHLYGVTPLFVHHNGKGTEKSAPSKNSILGSQGFESSMRSVIELRADQYDSEKRHLCILKQNYLPEDDKKQSYVLQLNNKMIFSNTGERQDLAFLAITNQKVVKDEGLTQRVLQLSQDGFSLRNIEADFKEQGIQIGRTRIGEIINKNKALKLTAELESSSEETFQMGKIVPIGTGNENLLFNMKTDEEDANEDSG
jgi:energy-coupling factor transporter ATP-binding protein EcfA2